MDSGRISVRYAVALLNWSFENGCEQKVYDECSILLNALDSNADFRNLIANNYAHSSKSNILIIEFSRAFSPSLEPFIALLIKKQRINYLQNILLLFQLKYRQKIGLTRVSITSAHKLLPSGKLKIENYLAEQIGGKLEVNYSVEPSLIGGFIANIEGKLLDKSSKNELFQIRKSIIGLA